MNLEQDIASAIAACCVCDNLHFWEIFTDKPISRYIKKLRRWTVHLNDSEYYQNIRPYGSVVYLNPKYTPRSFWKYADSLVPHNTVFVNADTHPIGWRPIWRGTLPVPATEANREGQVHYETQYLLIKT